MFARFFDDGLAQASFLVACDRTREAAVIDPRRDIDVYVSAARRHGLALIYAIETHIHADFVSGARELVALGARVVAGPGADPQFAHHAARHGERLGLGDIGLEVLHTPGHTPEHISIVVREPGQPVRALTGDTLFVGAVGRPDLLGEDQARALAHQLHESLFDILLKLPDDVEVHPGHGAGSLCGAGIGNAPFSLLAQERRFNPMLQHGDRNAFVAAVLADLPETPPYFRRMKRVNHQGPPVLNLAQGVDAPAAVSSRSLAARMNEGATVLDLRTREAFAGGHLKGSIHMAFGARIGYWAGWIVDPDAPIMCVTESDHQAVEARRQLLRIGLDRLEGTARADVREWQSEGLAVASTPQMSARDLQTRLETGSRLTVLDVRTRREWEGGHIDTATHVPVGELPRRVSELPQSGEVAVICEGGFRSSLASSLLERAGVSVVNVADGMAAYRELEPAR